MSEFSVDNCKVFKRSAPFNNLGSLSLVTVVHPIQTFLDRDSKRLGYIQRLLHCHQVLYEQSSVGFSVSGSTWY